MYKALKHGIDVPVVAGIMPITNANQVKRSIALSGSLVPRRFLAIVDRFGSDPAAMKQASWLYCHGPACFSPWCMRNRAALPFAAQK